MSKKTKKKVISTVKRPSTDKKNIAVTVSKTKSKASAGNSDRTLLFSTETYKWMGIGVAIMALGYILMLGGEMPDTNTWDDSIIYSFRRTVLSPFLILLGLGLNVYAVFKK